MGKNKQANDGNNKNKQKKTEVDEIQQQFSNNKQSLPSILPEDLFPNLNPQQNVEDNGLYTHIIFEVKGRCIFQTKPHMGRTIGFAKEQIENALKGKNVLEESSIEIKYVETKENQEEIK